MGEAAPKEKKTGLLPYASLHIDATYGQFFKAAGSIVKCDNPKIVADKVESLFGGSHQCLASFCVRTAFDLYLQVAAYPRRSQIIMTAINIPDMARIVRHHDLDVVSVDVDPETLAPDARSLEAVVTSKSVAIVVAHLYGRWIDVTDVVAFAKRRRIDFVEDCAQTFAGFERLGHPDALLSLFSFGGIKHATGFGGGVTIVRNRGLLKKMRDRQLTYPVYSKWMFFKRLARYFIVALTLNSPTVNRYGRRLVAFFGIDHKKYAVQLLRGFNGVDLMTFLRWQPSGALFSALLDALLRFSADEYRRNVSHCEYVASRLPESVQIPGSRATVRNHWLFPIIVSNADAYIDELNQRGVDAYRGATQLDVVRADETVRQTKAFPRPSRAEELMAHVIYLPVHKRVPLDELERLCEIVTDVADVVDARRRFRLKSKL